MVSDKLYYSIDAVLSAVAETAQAGAVYNGLNDWHRRLNSRVCDLCRFCMEHPATSAFCRHACYDATMLSHSSGEPYFYRCWAGLFFVTIAAAPGNRCCGGISLGGYCAEGDGVGGVEHALEQRLASLPNARVGDFVKHLGSVRPLSPDALRGLGTFALEATFSNGLNDPEYFSGLNSRYVQQRAIADAFAALPVDASSPADILGDTYHLLAHPRALSREGAIQLSSGYLAKLLLICNWDQEKFRAHLRVLLAVITSQSILGGMSWQEATGRELRHLARLEQAHSTEDCCYVVAEIVTEHFAESVREEGDRGTLSERAMRWLEAHYGDPVSLVDLATAVGASVSALGHGLKRETGKTFSTSLREIRLAAAKRLLATTDMELTEITELCGFFDQSHFTRTLRDATTLTPGKFREMLHLPATDVG